jgi:hypothetical protein
VQGAAGGAKEVEDPEEADAIRSQVRARDINETTTTVD